MFANTQDTFKHDDSKASRLERLDNSLKYNLESLKEQLKEQDRMDHFKIHRDLLMKDYDSQKLVINGEAEVSKLYFDSLSEDAVSSFNFNTNSSIVYVAPNGGQYDYRIGTYYTYRYIEEYYTKPQLDTILLAYTPSFTVGGFCSLVVSIIAANKIPAAGMAIAGYTMMDYLSKYVMYQKIQDCSAYGYGFNRTVYEGDSNYRSTVWFRWETYPNVPRQSSAWSHNFYWF